MLVANQQTISLGNINYGDARQFKYILKNTSSSPVTISKISVGCGSCTRAYTDKAVIEPEGETAINVTFTPNSTGIQSKSITIGYGSNSLSLKFTATVS